MIQQNLSPSYLERTVINYESMTNERKAMTNEEIVTKSEAVVSSYYSLDIPILRSETRKREYVKARQILFWIQEQLTTLSLNKIGGPYGKDHSTVLHGKRIINDLVAVNDKYGKDALVLLSKVKT